VHKSIGLVLVEDDREVKSDPSLSVIINDGPVAEYNELPFSVG
jgi:hypothetical protein